MAKIKQAGRGNSGAPMTYCRLLCCRHRERDGAREPFRRWGPSLPAKLGPDETLGIGCEGLPGLFCPIDNLCFDFVFIHGFLTIDSPVELDVVAVYSAREAEGQVQTLDVVSIEPDSLQEEMRGR